MSEPVKSVLLVEDDARLGPIVRDVLARDWRVTLVTNLADARSQARLLLFDVAVVDRRLPDGDGTEFVGWLREQGLSLPVLILTALGEVADRVAGLDAGANDYLVKPFDFAELQARLRALTRDLSRADQGVSIGSWQFYPHNDTVVSPYSGRILLTEKESALLGQLVQHPNTALTRKQLLNAVFDRGELEGTIDTYVHYVRKKTEPGLIETVRGVGYRLGTPA